MKRILAIGVWVMAGILFVAVAITALSDRLLLTPLTFEKLQQIQEEQSASSINLNTATAEDLKKLEGIGDVLAARIIAYRDAHGTFRTVEDLLDVEGIGETRLEQWRPYLIVE